MRILVACEYSGRVRDAFIRRGHDAISCDLLATEQPGPHYQGPVEDILQDGWDMLIAHPPCTHLAVSGARWFVGKEEQQSAAIDFVHKLLTAKINKIALENPVGVIGSFIGMPKATQCIQPWQFGHGEVKKTCLWLKNLPKLIPTNIVAGREAKIHKMAPSPTRGKDRSRTYLGIAEAMAQQWG